MNIKQLSILILFLTTAFGTVSAEEDYSWLEVAREYDYIYEGDFVYLVINELNIISYEKIDQGIYDNGIIYTVYKLNESIIITLSIDENGYYYLIGNVETNGAMIEILDYLTGIYSKPIPYLNGESYTAFFHDTENIYIKDNFPDYVGTFTLYGNNMFVEEVITQEKIIIQRQWCTPDFYEIKSNEIGDIWGFIASWDTVVYEDVRLPAQYTVRLWRETGDSLSTIAGLPFIYGNPIHWRVLYEANRNKLQNPDNPHLIHPGMVLDIPSLSGEERSGLWIFEE